MRVNLPCVNRKTALLAGYDLGSETPHLDIDIAALTENDRKTLVECLQIKNDGTGLSYLDVDVPTVEALLAAARAKQAAEEQEAKELLARLIRATEQFETVELVPATLSAGVIGQYQGYKIPHIDYPWSYQFEGSEEFRRFKIAKESLERRRDELNNAALEAARPALEAAFEARRQAAAEKEAEEKAKKQREIDIRAAKRLETGYWELETAAYNERREGKPWCAKVTGVGAGGKLNYEWAEWTGHIGQSGLLRVACKPGEIIACGQKDLRKPQRSWHQLLRMKDNGRMVEVTPAQAAKHLREQK